MLSLLSKYFNLNIFVFIVSVYIVLIFYTKELKKKIRHDTIVEMLTFIRYILLLSPIFLLILFGVYKYFDLDSNFLSRGLHLLTVLFTYLIITFISNLILKKGLKVMSGLSNKYLILVPLINIILNFIYITNQYFDFFTELDLIGHYFSILKLDNENIFMSHLIFGYLMFESFIILIYVLFVINIEDEKILKFICSDKSNKLDRNCISEIIHDIFTYTMFIKFIACVIFLIVIQFVKTKQGGDNITLEANVANDDHVDNADSAPGNADSTPSNAPGNADNADPVAIAGNDNSTFGNSPVVTNNFSSVKQKIKNTANKTLQYGKASLGDIAKKSKNILQKVKIN